MINNILNDKNSFHTISIGTHRLEQQVNLTSYFDMAIKSGYKAFDTAQGYGNEKLIGEALKRIGIYRNEIYLTTKLDDIYQNYYEAKHAIERSLIDLNTEYIDCFLIHSPNSSRLRDWAIKNGYSIEDYWKELNIEAWAALEEYKKLGYINTIGVSNFRRNHLENLCQKSNTIPAINQIKLCIGSIPIQNQIIDYCNEIGISLCGYRVLGKGNLIKEDIILELAKKYDKTPIQIIINFHWYSGYFMVMKLSKQNHLLEPIGYDSFTMCKDDYDMLKNYYSNTDYAKINNPDTGKGLDIYG